MIEYLKQRTLRFRYALVKRLAPHLYKDWLLYGGAVASGTPRPMILAAKQHFKNQKSLVGVEIGVYEGVNALSILRTLPMRHLFLVDPYLDTGFCLFILKQRLKLFPEAFLYKLPSEKAISKIPLTVDFVYIDGDHSYEAVKRDITQYYALTRADGLIGGHDYEDVRSAVDEFVVKYKLDLHVEERDWWVIKP